jgi:hypothetical protein
MAKLALRTPDDVKRLFSALADVPLLHENAGMSEVDELGLAETGLFFNTPGLGLSFLVALATGWTAIKGYERNGSMPMGLAWGLLGFMFPVPAVVYTAVRS